MTVGAQLSSTSLYFYINGKPHLVEKPNPEHFLIDYLREHRLTGTKLVCGEGGCGACTVMVSHFDHHKNKIINRSVNACIAPLCTLDGCHIVTVEGIGSTRDVMHPVQMSMATSNASQCGFCTPGFVMALYTLLRNNPLPSEHDVEECLDGNLCRCTGYRPILDAAKIFTKKAKKHGIEINEQVKICPTSGKPCACGNAGVQKEGQEPAPEHKQPLPTATNECPLVGQKHLLFPHELKKLPPRELLFQTNQVSWYTPTSLESLLKLKEQHPSCKLVVGNTELGIDTRFRNSVYPVQVYVGQIPELTEIHESEKGVTVGTSVTLSDLMRLLKSQISKAEQDPATSHKARGFKAALDNLKLFASTPIRNVASVGGNLVTASPISDLNPVWSALNASLNIIDTKGGQRTLLARDFFLDYRKVDLRQDEIVKSVFIPFTEANEYAKAYKQAKRREDDIAIVTSCIRMKFDTKTSPGKAIITDCSLSYGGMSKKTVNTVKTEQYLKGKAFTEEVFNEAVEFLKEDLPLAPQAPGGMTEYRRALTLSFFYKFYLYVQSEVLGSIAPELKSAVTGFNRPVSSGEQIFEIKKQGTAVGLPENHMAAALQTTGEAIYTDDIPKQQNELQAAFVLTTEANAEIVSIDPSEALKMEGVVGFFGAKDVPGKNLFTVILLDEELFRDKYSTAVGQPLGIIVAETQLQAKKAALKVKVTYKSIGEPVMTMAEAIERQTFIGTRYKVEDGDIEAVFRQHREQNHHHHHHHGSATTTHSEHNNHSKTIILEGDVSMGGQEHFYLETNAALVIPGEGDEYVVWSSTQNIQKTQKCLSVFLNVPYSKITSKLKRIGGGFGGKETRAVFAAGAASVAAYRLRRPIRIVVDRDVDMALFGQRHPFHYKYRVAVHPDGKLEGLDIKIYSNAGYSLDLSGSVMERAVTHVDNCYRFPSMKVQGFCCFTNTASNTAFRGFGGPQGMFATEVIMDHIAEHLKIPIEKLREMNFYKKNDKTHFGQAIVDGERIENLYNQCKQVANYDARKAAVEKFNTENKLRKRGIALMPTKFGIGFIASFLNQGGALVHIYLDGTVLITIGGVEMGQGLNTKVAQVAASVLDIPLSLVHIVEASTDKVPNSSPTAASVGTDLYGAAVKDACDQLAARLQPLRQRLPKASWPEIIDVAYHERVNLSAQGFFSMPDVSMDWKTGKGTPFRYFTYGAAVSEIEVDTLTGDFHVLRTDIVMDVGDSINPALDIGQIEGAFVQGMGLFTMEELIYGDKAHQWVRPKGGLFTKGPGNYKIPSLNDIPIDFKVHLLKNASNPLAIYSSKAIGEPPLFLGASVFFALKHAIKSARADNGITGYFVLDSPATTERIRMACADKIAQHFVENPAKFRPEGSF